MSEVQESPQRFSGTIANVELLSLVQLICLSQTNHAIAVHSDLGRGSIYAHSGRLYNAQCGELRGEDAFYEILSWTKGKLAAAPHIFVENAATMTQRWEYLLVQAARNRSDALELQERAGTLNLESHGFSGIIKAISLADLVQLICLSGGDHTIKVVSSAGTGILYARSGQICHAEAGALTGIEAFTWILGLSGGYFEPLVSHIVEQPTMSMSWEYLLMEAMRLRDEISDPQGARDDDEEMGKGEYNEETDLLSSGTGPVGSETPADASQTDFIPPIGFSGSITHIQLTDLLQLFCLGKSIHQIVLKSPEGTGIILVGSGRIFHAELGNQEGEPPFYQMHQWSEGHFKAKPAGNQEIKESIQKTWEFLLIEGARHRGQAEGDDGRESEGQEPSQSSFEGAIYGVELSDLMHLVCLARSRHMITIVSKNRSATIYVRDRQIFHAQAGELQGIDAFIEAFRWISGRFDAAPLQEEASVPTTIEMPWEYLLMEAMRLMDEESATGEEDGEGERESRKPRTEADALEKKLRKMNTLKQMEALSQKLAKMKVTEKIRLALTGNKETRSSLIREANRMIQLAVIRNPKISEQEVQLIASSKNVDEEVLRQLAANNKWTRSYALRLAMVNNPRTPLPTALKFVTTLTHRDLAVVAKSKNVSDGVVQAARRKVAQSGAR
jgi:hypothetical protein